MADLPALPVVLSTALLDSVNPCAIGVLVVLISTLLSLSKDRKKMLTVGSIYITAVFVTYLAAGFGLLIVIQKLSTGITNIITYAVGILIIGMGLVEIKDYFWYGQGFSLQIPARRAKQIQKMMKKISIPGSIVLGMFVAAVELPCTGGPYLAITTLLAKIGLSWPVFWLLVLYNFIFVLPLIVILLMVYFGVSSKKIQKWKDSNKKYMRLGMGLFMILLGVLMILWARGVIHIGIQ